MAKDVYSRMILVEGRNDQYVMRSLLEAHDVPCAIPDRGRITDQAIVIRQAGSVERLLNSLEVILLDGDLECLGIVMDADTDLDARWQSLKGILNKYGGRNLPACPSPEGIITELEQQQRTLPVGVWMMPDNQLPGILENFIQFLIPDHDNLWAQAEECVVRIPEDRRRFSPLALPKAKVHTWLAWQEEPGQPLGIAITARYLDCNAPHAVALVNWVKRLFAL